MNYQKIFPVLVSISVLITFAIVQERSRALGAIIASMPVSAPLAMWIVYTSTGGDHDETAFFARSMIYGIVATLVFVAACWLCLRQRWSLPASLAVGYAAWFAILMLPALFGRIGR
jgi:hypothetical protein